MAKTIEAYKPLAQGTTGIDSILVGTNHRKVFNQDRLQELADNIKQVGILEPILTRPADKVPDMILVAGARRLAAAKLAGLTEVPYRMLQLDDAQANEVQALENLHRENLSPIEEARAFKTLLDQGSYGVEDLAGRVNKHITYVYRAIKLLELPEAAITAIEQGTLTPAHGHQILSVSPDQREELLKYALTKESWRESLPTAQELRCHINSLFGTELDRAVFDTTALVPGVDVNACTTCEHNSANQSMLFDAAEEGKCLNKKCFDQKTKAFDDNLAEQARGEYQGMTYLGVKDWKWGHTQIYKGEASESAKTFGKDGLIISPFLKGIPAIKSALKKTPEKFGYGVLKGEHKLVLVLTDKALVLELTPKTSGTAQTESPEAREARQKEAFFKEAEARALLKAAVADKKPVTVPMLADLVFNQDCDNDAMPYIGEALGLKEINEKTLLKLQPAVLIKLLWIGKALEYDYVREIMDENCFKPLRLETAKIRAQARKAAVPAYEAYKAEQAELRAKAEAEKAGKKAKAKQEPEEEETGEEGDND